MAESNEKKRKPARRRRAQPARGETPAELDSRLEEPAWGDEGGAGPYEGGPMTQGHKPKSGR